MDSLTHVVLGACTGEALLGKRLGKKAMLWGAIAESIPDIDFVSGFWLNPANDLLAHRGFTHSLLFAVLATPFTALLAEKWHRPHNISLKKWMLFFGIGILVHLFIDLFNVYGTGLLEPFSNQRFSFNTLFVADPFFSVVPAIAFTILLVLHKKHRHRMRWAFIGMLAPALYLVMAVYNKLSIDTAVTNIAAAQEVPAKRYFTTPVPLNNFLWYAVMESDSGYHIGYRSVFDKKQQISFRYFPRNENLLDTLRDHEDLQHLLRFSQGYYTCEQWGDTLVFNDLRFGQMIGWQQPDARFVFHYYLSHPEDNELVVQRGRFANWDMHAIESLIQRIKGE